MFGAVVLSFDLLALAVLNLLCAPLIRCLAWSRLFSIRYELRCTAKMAVSTHG
jgi:hypothetical protein